MGPYPATNKPPVASFTVSPSSGTLETTFTADASSSRDLEDATSRLEVRWDWDDGSGWTGWSTAKVAQHRYANPGTYTIHLEVRDTGGLTNATTRQVAVYRFLLSVGANPNSGYVPLRISFTANATGGIPPYTYSSTFGDENSSREVNPTHTCTKAGTYDVHLVVTDSLGTRTTASVSISVVTPLDATIQVDTSGGTAPLTVHFTSRTSGGTPPYSFNWDFGDGSRSTDQNPSHTYAAAKSYTVTFESEDGSGQRIMKTLQITARENASPFASPISLAGIGVGIAIAAGVGALVARRRRRHLPP